MAPHQPTLAGPVTGVIEHGGIPVPPRPEAVPPPHWRLEAISSVERPRQPHVVDGTIALIVDRDTSDVWVLGGTEQPPQRWTVDRAIAPFWEDTGPRLAPDGSTVAYTNRGWVWITAGGVPRRLAEAGSPVWLDAGRLIVEVDKDDHGVLGLIDLGEPAAEAVGRTTTAWVAPLLDLPGDLGEVAVSPDGTRLVAVRSPRDDLNASRLVVFEPVSGSVVELDGPPAMHDRGPVWSPDGRRIVFASEAPGWYELHLWDPATGSRTPLTESGADFSEPAWSAAGLAAIRTRHGVGDLVTVDPDAAPGSAGQVVVVAEGGVWSSPCWSGGDLIAVHEAPDIAPRLVRVSPSSGATEPGTITEVWAPTPRAVRLAPHVIPEHVWYPAPGGDVPAFLYRPRAASAETPVAAIVHPHGGPTSHYGAEWDGVAQYFVDKGYAWLAPNFKGSTSYGRDHERADHGEWGVVDTQDCLAAHEWLAGQDWVDARRIGIFGASYGSYMALLSLVDGDRFACGVAKYGDCDILTSWAQGDRLGRLDLERMMGHPAGDPTGYRTGSPIHRIESISAPILIAHGERDDRVHPNQSIELVEALRRIGATYEYVTYPTEGHGFLRRDPFLDFYARLERFLDWYLM